MRDWKEATNSHFVRYSKSLEPLTPSSPRGQRQKVSNNGRGAGVEQGWPT